MVQVHVPRGVGVRVPPWAPKIPRKSFLREAFLFSSVGFLDAALPAKPPSPGAVTARTNLAPPSLPINQGERHENTTRHPPAGRQHGIRSTGFPLYLHSRHLRASPARLPG